MFLHLNIKRVFFTKTFLYFSIVPNQITKLFIAATKSITTALSVPICHATFGASYQMLWIRLCIALVSSFRI